MKFNLENKSEVNKALDYLTTLIGKHSLVEIKKISPARTKNQNAYLHLIIGAFGSNFGYTAIEAKQVYKEVNSSVYRYTKKGRVFWRSSADLTKEEMAKTIDHFRLKSAETGFPLPLATDKGWLIEIENEMERNKYYL